MGSGRDKLFSLRMRATRGGRHISGAEGIFSEKEIPEKTVEFALRALNHSKGKPDSVDLGIELLKRKPILISSLPLYTLNIKNTGEAWRKAESLLAGMGITQKAFSSARKVISGGEMRGASLIGSERGKRLEPDRARGIRATKFGIKKISEKKLEKFLNEMGLRHHRTKEALILASKVASAPGVIAELCVSDDPGYTTGYIASRKLGYLRFPHFKRKGSNEGGRVFFTGESTDISALIRYLEETPVLIGKIAPLSGIISVHDDETACRVHLEPGLKKSINKKD